MAVSNMVTRRSGEDLGRGVSEIPLKLICDAGPGGSSRSHAALTNLTNSPVFLEGMLGNALRISPIPERRAVDSAIDAASGPSLGSTMLFPASLISEK